MKPKYYLKGEEFVIENYNYAKPFSSFLPGVAGFDGRPVWAFYVNRGQCMASFGVNSKEGAIMEFYPANTAYRRTPLEGFRTFIKFNERDGRSAVYEPFMLSRPTDKGNVHQALYISPHEFRIEDKAEAIFLKCEAVFYSIPGEDFPALARVLNITNLSSSKRHIEVIDGMPKICPYGMNEFFMKHMSRTIEAWMEVSDIEDNTPFYKLRVDAADISEVKYITSGNFYLNMASSGKPGPVIVDPKLVFGDFQDFVYPAHFAAENFNINKKQVEKNITPSAFSYHKFSIPPKETVSVFSLMGQAESYDNLKSINKKLSEKFFIGKREENKGLVAGISSATAVFSGIKKIDLYTAQTSLDNILRGGLPVSMPGDNVIYVFNRKHGDLERDYNNFVLRAEPYSQGNGNFRDTNQNRRLSAWINPEVGWKDIKDFYNLIQLDGYNPLVVKWETLSLNKDKGGKRFIGKYFGGKNKTKAEEFFKCKFTLGQLIEFNRSFGVKIYKGAFLKDLFDNSVCAISAEHGEGFWIDHWAYNLDLVENFIALFPERKEEILFSRKEFLFFDNDHVVEPRTKRFVAGAKGCIRQYNSVILDEEKSLLIKSRASDSSWVRVKSGKGAIYRCALIVKIFSLTANKIATLDPEGVGVEMEADKPGWCDSLNGLPGLAGSSLCETFELLRMVEFLQKELSEKRLKEIAIYEELADFIGALTGILSKNTAVNAPLNDYGYWDSSNSLKEKYRDRTRLGLSGKEKKVPARKALDFLALAARKLKKGIAKGCDMNGLPYTYFINEAEGFNKKKGYPKAFKQRPLPVFLEGPVRAFKTIKNKAEAKKLLEGIRKSPLYDEALKMFRLNASLEKEPLEIGRSRIFTPGWLENESIWLHMEYKLLLEILRSGLYEDFFKEFKNTIIPFQDPEKYGRSILENSSFIASSKFFDPDLRGAGFVARLSGATAEFLNMLLMMNLGKEPFSVSGGKVIFKPSPVLEKEFFTKEAKEIEFHFQGGKKRLEMPSGSYGFSLFSNTLVVYKNPRMKDTFGHDSVRVREFKILYQNGKEAKVAGFSLGEPYSRDLRKKLIDRLDITLE